VWLRDGRRIVPQPAAVTLAAIDFVDERIQQRPQPRRELRRLFEGRIQALELETVKGTGVFFDS